MRDRRSPIRNGKLTHRLLITDYWFTDYPPAVTAPQKTPDKPLTPTQAWQPFTPRGVAAFGLASFMRVFLVQGVVTVLVGIALIWALRAAWVPVISEAIQQLPATGNIQRGELHFPGESPQRLAENSQLAIVVDLEGTRAVGQVADLEIAFEKKRFVLRGPLGAFWRDYGTTYQFNFNRPELTPWWDAHRWAILLLLALALGVAVFASWWALALVYVPVVKFIAFFADHAVTWGGAWRVSAAALLPGACLVALALILYGVGAIPLFQFGLLYALHIVAGLIFVLTSPFFLPKISVLLASKNPFGLPDDLTPPGPSAGAGKM